MFIQGDLQAVFDALFVVGAIDPVLKMNWETVTSDMNLHPEAVKVVVEEINACGGDRELLVKKFHEMEQRLINFAALEVAREFCEFQERQTLH